MRAGGLTPLGGGGKIVEADATYYGNIPESERRTVRTGRKPFIKKGKLRSSKQARRRRAR